MIEQHFKCDACKEYVCPVDKPDKYNEGVITVPTVTICSKINVVAFGQLHFCNADCLSEWAKTVRIPK